MVEFIIVFSDKLRSRLPVRASQYALNKWLRPTAPPTIFTPPHCIGRGAVLGRHTPPTSSYMRSTNT